MRPKFHPLALATILSCVSTFSWSAPNPTAILSVDAAADRQAIHPEIYGVMFGLEADLKANNTTINRHGGNYATRYNWQLTAANRISRLSDFSVSASQARLTVPAQSITLLIIPKGG